MVPLGRTECTGRGVVGMESFQGVASKVLVTSGREIRKWGLIQAKINQAWRLGRRKEGFVGSFEEEGVHWTRCCCVSLAVVVFVVADFAGCCCCGEEKEKRGGCC